MSDRRPWRGFFAFTAGMVSGLVNALAGRGMLTRRRFSPPRAGDYGTLPNRLFGHTKGEVARLLGPPPAAAVGNGGPPSKPTFWHANVWYYPVDPEHQRAVAVQFNADRVVKVDILGA
jgi:hypothetical protein